MASRMDEFPIRATAPVVGRHKKSKSLAHFDPLLKDELKASDPLGGLSLNSESNNAEQEEDVAATTTTQVPSVNQEELYSELRAIASELGKTAPNRSNAFSSNKQPKPQQHDQKDEKKEGDGAQSPAPPTPMRNVSRAGRRTPNGPSPAPSPAGRKPRWGSRQVAANNKKPTRHNRTRSMPLIGASWTGGGGAGATKKSPARNSKKSTPAHSRASSRASLSSDMLQELWELQEQAEVKVASSTAPTGELSIPSLAKPRPTSFLTGKEVVLSSEADATEWQLEIPVKTEFIYTCRASSFLHTYRTEKDGSLDLNSLVGCTSADLAMFVGGNPSPNTNKLKESHRPMVETLLECGTDLMQVQGFLRSKPVNGDPASFREVFIVERQRQFLCVFRGTPTEQQGKLEKQPETVKLFDNKNVSVFADRCRALQELEPQLFGKLDQLMEDNPFCDFVFAGHAFGGALATLAAFRYAWSRPELRVAALVTGNVKVGLPDFRLSANSLPNLKLVRVELGHTRPVTNSGVHVGHTIHIHPGKMGAQVKAYKFSDEGPANTGGGPMRKLRFNNKDKTIADYVDALDDLGESWVKDYFREDHGSGVRGKDNETRLVV